MEYLILFAIGIYILYAIIKYISSYPDRKRLRERTEAIKAALNDFDVITERQNIIKLLKENLPEGYRCGRRHCDGILLKQISNSGGSYYVCSKCHNIRHTIKI